MCSYRPQCHTVVYLLHTVYLAEWLISSYLIIVANVSMVVVLRDHAALECMLYIHIVYIGDTINTSSWEPPGKYGEG